MSDPALIRLILRSATGRRIWRRTGGILTFHEADSRSCGRLVRIHRSSRCSATGYRHKINAPRLHERAIRRSRIDLKKTTDRCQRSWQRDWKRCTLPFVPPPDDDKVKSLDSRYADFEPAAAPPGGPAVGYAAEPAEVADAMTPENTICLRGPCRHFWQLVSTAPMGNPKGTFEELGLREPRQYSYACLTHPGTETDLGEDVIYECSRWDPMTNRELVRLRRRRDDYDHRTSTFVAAAEEALDVVERTSVARRFFRWLAFWRR